jgi:hypothetical protein
MPVRVEEPVRLVSVARMSADRKRGAMMLVNAGMDPIAEATVHIRTTARTARVLTVGHSESALELNSGKITLRNIPSWGLRAVLFLQ